MKRQGINTPKGFPASTDLPLKKRVKRIPSSPPSLVNEMPIVQFYSKSKDEDDLGHLGYGSKIDLSIPNWRKVLSNFYPSEITLRSENTTYTYPSVEHAFQAAKARCSSLPAFAKDFESGQSIGMKTPPEAKNAGGKGSYRKLNITLDFEKWDKE